MEVRKGYEIKERKREEVWGEGQAPRLGLYLEVEEKRPNHNL